MQHFVAVVSFFKQCFFSRYKDGGTQQDVYVGVKEVPVLTHKDVYPLKKTPANKKCNRVLKLF